VYQYYLDMIYNARHAGVDNVRLVMATSLPAQTTGTTRR